MNSYALNTSTGYLHSDYARSLTEFGIPRKLPHCDGWILERTIPDHHRYDAMGCYPLFACQDWSMLWADLEEIGPKLVTISMVTDPFGKYTQEYLVKCFGDVVIPFKEHFIVELEHSMNDFVSAHHQRYARKALEKLHIERIADPYSLIDEWMELYSFLISRHNIKGIRAFSRRAFSIQLRIPGIEAFRAVFREKTVGMTLWYRHRDVGYYHLGAFSPLGYDVRASFALFWFAIDYFKNKLGWLNLGSGAGIKGDGKDGLNRFKKGWSTGVRTAYFCGRIFDHAFYSEILHAKGISHKEYFPAYRSPDFE